MKSLHIINYIKSTPWNKYRTEFQRYLLLLLIPVFLLTILYAGVYHIATEQINSLSQLTLQHFYTQSTYMLNEMKLVSDTLKKDITILSELNSDKSIDPMTVCQQIKSDMEDSPYVQHVYLIKESNGEIFSDKGLFNAESIDSLLLGLGINDEDLLNSSDMEGSHVLNPNDITPYYISAVTDSSGEKLGTIIITLRMTEFLKIFYSLNADFCAIFNDTVFIASNFSRFKMNDIDWYDEAAISALIDTPVKCTYLETDNYTYVVAFSKTSFYRPLRFILTAFILYLLTVLLFGFLYLYHVSKKRYMNLEHLIEALPDSYEQSPSFEDIYDNIRASLQSYQKQSQKHQQWKNERQLWEMISKPKGVFSKNLYTTVGLPAAEGYTFYVVTFFTKHAVSPALQIDNLSDIHEYVNVLFRSTITELSGRFHIDFAYCSEHAQYIAIFYDTDAQLLTEAVHSISRDIIELLSDSYELNIRSTISRAFTSLSDLSDAYVETQQLHQFVQSINSDAATVSQEELRNSSSFLLSGDFVRQQQILSNTILTKKYASVPSMVNSILTTLVTPIRKNYALARTRLIAIANVLIEGVYMSSLPDNEKDKNIQALNHADSVQALIEISQQVYQEIEQKCHHTETQNSIVMTACDYITQNLSDPNLNVSAICENAGVQQQRLTRLFHERFNMAIAEYMNSLRIEEAKKLLKETDLTVSKIALQVGYTNTDTLTRNFKKIEGITPSEYRRS